MDKERLEIAVVNVHETSGLVTSDVHTEDTSNYFESILSYLFLLEKYSLLHLLSLDHS